MAKAYQLVAWTEKGRVRMIPSEVIAFMHQSIDEIDRISDKVWEREENWEFTKSLNFGRNEVYRRRRG